MRGFETDLARAMTGVTSANTPPLAQWLISLLAHEFSKSTTCERLNLAVRSTVEEVRHVSHPEPDALFSLWSTSGRSADVWVEWCVLKNSQCSVVVSIWTDEREAAGATADIRERAWDPAQLVQWLDTGWAP